MPESTGSAGKAPDKSFFSGPPSNKVTAGTLGAAVATLFWAIAARTFWKTMTADDITLYVSATAVVLTMVFGFVLPESAAFTMHSASRLDAGRSESPASEQSATAPVVPIDDKTESAINDLKERVTALEHHHAQTETKKAA